MLNCASCGRENPIDARFRNDGVAALAAATPQRETRKTVTVLFCDVRPGSTALGESTYPEALRALLARWFVTLSLRDASRKVKRGERPRETNPRRTENPPISGVFRSG